MLEKIISFFKKALSKDYIGVSLSVLIVLLLVFNFQTCQNLSYEKKQREFDNENYKNNIKAQGDSLKAYFDKRLNAVVTEKTSYIVNSVNDLKDYDKALYNDMKSVKGSVAGIQSTVNGIIPAIRKEIREALQDSIDSTKFTIPWDFPYSDEGLTQTLVGKTTFKVLDNKPASPMFSELTKNEFSIKLKYNISEKDNKYVVKAYSPSKIVTFSDLDAVIILDKLPKQEPKKQTPWSFGPQVGFGMNTDIKGSNGRFGWYVGVGGSYNIFSGVKK